MTNMDPDNMFSTLCTEIDRILNSPYPVALKVIFDCIYTKGITYANDS